MGVKIDILLDFLYVFFIPRFGKQLYYLFGNLRI